MAIDGAHGTAMAIDELRWDLSTGSQLTRVNLKTMKPYDSLNSFTIVLVSSFIDRRTKRKKSKNQFWAELDEKFSSFNLRFV